MSSGVLILVGVLVVLTIVLLVYKVLKGAAVLGLVAACIYVGYAYVLPLWEAHVTPLVSRFL